MAVAGDVINPSGFVVNGNLLMAAEKHSQDTVLIEFDLSEITSVSTQLSGKVCTYHWPIMQFERSASAVRKNIYMYIKCSFVYVVNFRTSFHRRVKPFVLGHKLCLNHRFHAIVLIANIH